MHRTRGRNQNSTTKHRFSQLQFTQKQNAIIFYVYRPVSCDKGIQKTLIKPRQYAHHLSKFYVASAQPSLSQLQVTINLISVFSLLLLDFWPCHTACRICSLTRDWTWDMAVKAWNPNHQATRIFPKFLVYKINYTLIRSCTESPYTFTPAPSNGNSLQNYRTYQTRKLTLV